VHLPLSRELLYTYITTRQQIANTSVDPQHQILHCSRSYSYEPGCRLHTLYPLLHADELLTAVNQATSSKRYLIAESLERTVPYESRYLRADRA
jgi:hypothetical protein